MTAPETISVNCECGAHHESAHIVIAAVKGLRLKAEGLIVDPSGWGLSCYHNAPTDIGPGRDQNIVAVLAGFAVEERYREQHGYLPRDSMDVALNDDNVKARTWIAELAGDYWENESRLRDQLNGLIEEHWLTIDALASKLLGKNWEPIKPLKSGDRWSHPNETEAKYLTGEEAVLFLAERGIEAVVKA
jgi:hypothetical protein